jgi:molybdopterin/thiamine biosynthesis adenylyltransferase
MVIIGCGGVATYLVPALLRCFRDAHLIIFDGDTLEERNLDRQVFDTKLVGNNKAAALQNMLGNQRISVEERFFTIGKLACIICLADNHEARKLALNAGDDLKVPVFIAANELFDSESYVYLPAWKDHPQLDPRIKYPSIMTDITGSPLHCQEEQEASPQLAVANFAAAGKCATMIWRWLVEKDKDNKMHLHHENTYETITAFPK